ncbi:ATP-dependent endonuclease [Methylophilus sp. 13]|uniref:ATP-dependent nuclease n=1 Tax=Methylophilus sp. 13 TaxID=2781018 RepID=UPI00188E6D13|nr:TOPRIM nucleotidyl transferase/hydrolase domain-containing protein [Methylophilus sp. 13]MBF5039360.1 ATP-dependent endonuclease [Methylophilus sp. 13]
MADRSHLVRMHVKNIGCIGNDGLTIELDEIVCLVGANNAGKTTVLRAYELAVKQAELKLEDFNRNSNGNPASVELWVHIPKAAANVDEKWKEEADGLLLVRSKWEWPTQGGKPTRTTWDPETKEYAEDGKASGLDTVFNSRLPQPFRIGSLDDPQEEHKKLLTLVLEPVTRRYKTLMEDKESALSKKISELQAEAEKPVADFKEQLEKIQSQVNSSYQQVFNTAEIRLTVSLGDIGFDPQKSLSSSSRVDIAEKDGQARWDQQGTGSQRALFWSMLQVRSELNRLSDIQKGIEKDRTELAKLQAKAKKTKADETKIQNITEKLKKIDDAGDSEDKEDDSFLPGYMLLIDEPETALHPSAVRAAKEHLYALAAESGWQVMLSTHHPAFIDPLKDHTTIVRLHRIEAHLPPNIYRSEKIKFDGEEVENLKALMLFDSNVSEMFFGGHVVIVEGDTEFAAFHEAMRLNETIYPIDQRPLIVRARGKATIAILVKMLAHFKIEFSVLHDIDSPKTKDGDKTSPAYSINKNIADAISEARSIGIPVIYRCSCPNFEQHHGMDLPKKDKPFESWRAVRDVEAVRNSVLGVLQALIAKPKDTTLPPEDGSHYETQLKTWIKINGITDKSFQFD